jgi:hypothetical protein
MPPLLLLLLPSLLLLSPLLLLLHTKHTTLLTLRQTSRPRVQCNMLQQQTPSNTSTCPLVLTCFGASFSNSSLTPGSCLAAPKYLRVHSAQHAMHNATLCCVAASQHDHILSWVAQKDH